MKLLSDNTLCIEFEEFVTAKVAVEGKDRKKVEQYLWKAKSVKTKGYGFTNDPDDARKVLLIYDQMNEANRLVVETHFGDPRRYMVQEPISIAILQHDNRAVDFFLNYTYGSGKHLADDLIKKYTKAATVLQNLAVLWQDKKEIKRQFRCDLLEFKDHVVEIVKREKIDLPSSHQRLFGKNGSLHKFIDNGYASLIDWRVGNTLAKKIEDEVLKKLLEHPNQYDDVMVTYLYNGWAKQNGKDEIGPRIVTMRRSEWNDELIVSREGWNAFNEKYIRQVKGLPANTMHPLALVECDDYNFNFYFTDPDLPAGAQNLQRYVGYIVADSSLGLVLGTCYRPAKAPIFEMIRIAWIDAMYYIRSLAGDGNWYLPFEVKADHWNEKNAYPFFKSIAKMVPPAVSNKHRGYIEQLFGSEHAKRAEKIAAHEQLNYNGNNITARNTGVNVEAMKANAKHRPLIGDQACEQINKMIYYMRNMPAFTRENMQAPSLEVQWKERWAQLSDEQKRPISDMQFLYLFGIKHEPQGRPVSITNRGIEPVINGIKYSYDLPDYAGMQHLIGSKVYVIYDPYDMSRVLVTDHENIRFIAKSAILQPRALEYQYDGSRAALNMILAEKKKQVEKVAGMIEARKPLEIDHKAIMLGGMMPKELLADAEQAYHESSIPALPAPEQLTEEPEEEFNVYKNIFNR